MSISTIHQRLMAEREVRGAECIAKQSSRIRAANSECRHERPRSTLVDSPSTRNPLLKMVATDTLFSRRALLKRSAVGFGSLALASLLASESQVHASDENPLAAKTPHF